MLTRLAARAARAAIGVRLAAVFEFVGAACCGALLAWGADHALAIGGLRASLVCRTRGARASAINRGFISVVDLVRARRGQTMTVFAVAARAICARIAHEPSAAWAARTAAIYVGFSAVAHRIRAARGLANGSADQGSAITATATALVDCTWCTGSAAVDVAFGFVLLAVRARRRDGQRWGAQRGYASDTAAISVVGAVLVERARITAAAAVDVGFGAVDQPVTAGRRGHANARVTQATVAIGRSGAACAVSAHGTITAARFTRRHLRRASVHDRIAGNWIWRDAEAWNRAGAEHHQRERAARNDTHLRHKG